MKLYHLVILSGLLFGIGNSSLSIAQPTISLPEFADPGRLDRIKKVLPAMDKMFKNYFEKNHFPGLAYGLIVDGQLIHSAAYGVSNVAMKTVVDSKADFRIASMTKSFTAMAILRLRDEGKLQLTDLVSTYIPAVGKIKYLTQDSPAITIENLLTMSAGFPEDNPWGDRQLADKDEELIALIEKGLSFSTAPGLVYEYSNLGFGMLGHIVTKVAGKPFQEYITETIIKPLGMSDTRWEFTEVPKNQLALGYRWEDNAYKEEPILHDGSFGAMGGLISSIDDFSKYVAFHLSAWPPRDGSESPIIKRSSLREMHQLQKLGGLYPNAKGLNGQACAVITGYGYGLGYRKDCSNVVTIRHGGGLPGYGSEWKILPDYGIGIVALSNLTYGSLGTTSTLAIDTLLKLANLKPRVLPVSKILLQKQKEIVDLIQSWSADKLDILAENFLMDHSLDSWKSSTKKMLEDAGKIVKVGDIIPENQLRGSFIITGEKKRISAFFTLTPEGTPLLQLLDLKLIDK